MSAGQAEQVNSGPSQLLGLGRRGGAPATSHHGPSFQAPPASLEEAKQSYSKAEDGVGFC